MSGHPLPMGELRAAVEALPDPDLPVLTLGDLGMVGAVAAGPDGRAEVEITPTFAGCPAVDAIERAVRAVLAAGGHPQGRVRRTLVPAWTTERVSEAGLAASSPSTASPCGAARAARPARGAGPSGPCRSARSARPGARRCCGARPARRPSPD